jgi:hypothetical protein
MQLASGSLERLLGSDALLDGQRKESSERLGWSEKTTGARERYATALAAGVVAAAEAGQHLFGSVTVAGSQIGIGQVGHAGEENHGGMGLLVTDASHTFQLRGGVVNATQSKFKKTESSMRERLKHRFTALPGQPTASSPWRRQSSHRPRPASTRVNCARPRILSRMQPSE